MPGSMPGIPPQGVAPDGAYGQTAPAPPSSGGGSRSQGQGSGGGSNG